MLGLVVLWPALGYVNATQAVGTAVQLNTPAALGGWRASAALTEWQPHYLNTDARVHQSYDDGTARVGVYLEYYRHQRQDAELINSRNFLVKQKDPVWRQVADRSREISVGGKPLQIREAKLRSADQDLLVWYWYWMDGNYTTNHYLAKLWEGKAKLLGETGDAGAVILAAELGEKGDAEAVLAEFVEAMEPAIRASLEGAADDD